MYRKLVDGSIVDESGKIIFFSTKRFIDDICNGECCFICGAPPSSKPFNNEHVLPQWVLKKFSLHDRKITLPNLTTFRYDQYVVPCCLDCNALMGSQIEVPVSRLFESGFNAIAEHIQKNGALLFFVWMGLIFLKTHLKDRTLRANRDLRASDEKMIAADYAWEELHHIHTLSRCFYTGCSIEPEAMGSLLVMAAKTEASPEVFDFADLHVPQTMLIRMNDTAIFAVFNDSCGVINGMGPTLQKINGGLSELQLREFLADLAFVNLHIKICTSRIGQLSTPISTL